MQQFSLVLFCEYGFGTFCGEVKTLAVRRSSMSNDLVTVGWKNSLQDDRKSPKKTITTKRQHRVIVHLFISKLLRIFLTYLSVYKRTNAGMLKDFYSRSPANIDFCVFIEVSVVELEFLLKCVEDVSEKPVFHRREECRLWLFFFSQLVLVNLLLGGCYHFR